MKSYFFVPVLAAIILSTGCTAPAAVAAAATPKAGEQVQMTGRLALKGSMPMPQAVLTCDTGERWELTNMHPLIMGRLQNKRVTVQGKVVRAVATPMMLPSVAVTSITLAQ